MALLAIEPGRIWVTHSPPAPFVKFFYDAVADKTVYCERADKISFFYDAADNTLNAAITDAKTGVDTIVVMPNQSVPTIERWPPFLIGPPKTKPKIPVLPEPKPPVDAASKPVGPWVVDDPWAPWNDGTWGPGSQAGPFQGLPGGPGASGWLRGAIGGSRSSSSSAFTPTRTGGGSSSGGGGSSGSGTSGWRDLANTYLGDGPNPDPGGGGGRPQAGPYQGAGTERGSEGSGSGEDRRTGRATYEWVPFDPTSGSMTVEEAQANPTPGTRQGGMPDPTRDPSGLTGNPIIDAAIMQQARFFAGFVPAPTGPALALAPDAGANDRHDTSGTLDWEMLDPIAPVAGIYEGRGPRMRGGGRRVRMQNPAIQALYPEGGTSGSDGEDDETVALVEKMLAPKEPPQEPGGDPAALQGGARLVAYSAGVTSPTIEFDLAGRVRRIGR